MAELVIFLLDNVSAPSSDIERVLEFRLGCFTISEKINQIRAVFDSIVIRDAPQILQEILPDILAVKLFEVIIDVVLKGPHELLGE